MSHRTFLIWLCLLTVIAGLLFWLLNGGPVTPSVGGGGYDLAPFLYSWLLVLLSGFWTLAALVAGLATSDRSAARRAFFLAALGLAVLLLTLWLNGSDLS